MPFRLSVLLLLAAVSLIAPARAEEATSRRLCPEDAPEGVRLPPRTGCRNGASRAPVPEGDGFRDVGGVKLRVGGRVSAEYGLAR